MKYTWLIFIWLLPLNRSLAQSVTGAPSWSPDGRSFAYVAGTAQSNDVFIYDFTGENDFTTYLLGLLRMDPELVTGWATHCLHF